METKEDFIKAELNTTRLTPIQWQGIMIAMEKYAQEQVKLFTIPVVSKQRELLIAFYKWSYRTAPRPIISDENLIDEYLKSNL